jgi:serine/threonine protein kinase
MPLAVGTRLGAYEVTAKLGAGGMGGVYRATDTRLKREVAVKVLPAAFAADPERLARLQREAEVLASLNHPNIAAIHGLERLRPRRTEDERIRGEASASVRAGGGAPAPVEEADAHGGPCLVLELVEGPTLADRIAQGPIPLDEALPIARQIAEALEAAHEQGIVHRDLKPANVKLTVRGAPPPRTEDGRLERRLSAADVADCMVKVLDFGLAKALEPAGTGSSSASLSPTITTPAMSQAGMILGTAAYKSPEQARGKSVDKRADIWAFGCVLYEMVTGRRAFDGEDVSETLAAVLRADVDWAPWPEHRAPVLRTCVRSTSSPSHRPGRGAGFLGTAATGRSGHEPGTGCSTGRSAPRPTSP